MSSVFKRAQNFLYSENNPYVVLAEATLAVMCCNGCLNVGELRTGQGTRAETLGNDAFLVQSTAFNKYVEEIYRDLNQCFHNFLNLPPETRTMVYEMHVQTHRGNEHYLNENPTKRMIGLIKNQQPVVNGHGRTCIFHTLGTAVGNLVPRYVRPVHQVRQEIICLMMSKALI
ncbi:hypothetical protein K491DRAFT_684413 [Lophiostoma macrostomum CBS 122681]|uniref:Uncharacterized protein n=1 Tax=Lophiostoma macrostomum CBS 122681 TaxID=1314788 RepID=A0A6A6SP77_9PLEO|nr:hypothetical protein K491DRAFT_684413 [Lophiostoma macrostomum CBS 122681]